MEETLLFDNHSISENEAEGHAYILGYIVNKFKTKYPYLGEIAEPSTDWISVKSNGGINRMTQEFVVKFKIVEKIFNEVYGDRLREGSNSLGCITNKAVTIVPEVPKEVIEFYLRCRLHFRIKKLNKEVALCNVRKKFKKMAKTVK